MKKYKSERQMCADTLLSKGDYKNIHEILDRLVEFKPDAPIFGSLDKDKKIQVITSVQLREEVMNLGDGLISIGLKDKHIAIVADNSCRYVIADMCISTGVGTVTPIDVCADVPLLCTLFEKCDAQAVFCSCRVIDNLIQVQSKYPALQTIITIDGKVEGYLSYDEIIEKGKAMKDKGEYRNMDYDPSKTAKILFTSGTTGANKAVILTGENLVANAINTMDVIRAEKDNTSMSILPMHHATEINSHIMCRVAAGRLTYICSSIKNMMNEIKIFKPDCITIVPMIANAFYNTIWSTAKNQGKDKKLRKGIKICNLLRRFGIDPTHKMFADLYVPFGGKLNMIVCGGAMLNPVVVKGMYDLGIRMENGYGITECGPLVSMNGDPVEEFRTVGKAAPSLKVKLAGIDEQGVGELCISGKSVSKGYYKDPEATAAVFDEDGFFHTGDSAYIDKEGRIFIVGRKKNTIVLDNGKNICPEEVENVIEADLPYANDIVVYQAEIKENCNVICAGIYIEDEQKRNDRPSIMADLHSINAKLPSYKRIEYVELPDAAYERSATKKIIRTHLPARCSGEGIII